MILFVGLGNPTDAYQNTRHNFGFMVLDEFITHHETSFINKPKFKGFLFKSNSFFALKPSTYMNLSGESVVAVRDFYKIDKIIVLHDDLDLPLGSIRFKKGGSSGGHNGLKSIDSLIGTDYIRVRLGIGKPQNKGEVTSYVLQDFKKQEQECVKKVIDQACKALEMFLHSSLDGVMAKFTSKKGLC
ncbi:MAG: aminoacyl-tRNA hydrolase [Proteobacteria bacterium]|nr:MAG: aminoacyl-tRNA hydrolase [Pseudomonadota bacterium]